MYRFSAQDRNAHNDTITTRRIHLVYPAGYDSHGLLNNATQSRRTAAVHPQRDTGGQPTIRLTPHSILDQRGGVGAQRAAVERVYELRVTSYELVCNITIRLDANTNETANSTQCGVLLNSRVVVCDSKSVSNTPR